MNVKWLVQLSRGIISGSTKPKTIVILPGSTLHDERVLSEMRIVGNYTIRFKQIPNSHLWWSQTTVEPKILSNILDQRLRHNNFLVLRVE